VDLVEFGAEKIVAELLFERQNDPAVILARTVQDVIAAKFAVIENRMDLFRNDDAAGTRSLRAASDEGMRLHKNCQVAKPRRVRSTGCTKYAIPSPPQDQRYRPELSRGLRRRVLIALALLLFRTVGCRG